MTGRHRRPRRLSKEGRRLLGGAALLAVFAPVTVYTLNAAIAHVQSCGTETTLTVAAAPGLAPVLQDFVAQGGGAPSRGSDVCAEITVESVPTAEIAEADADVWIPETELVLDLPEAGLAEQWEVFNDSTASDAVGLALPEGVDASGIHPESAPIVLEDPAEDPASLLWIVMLGVDEDDVSGDDPDAFPVMAAAEARLRNAEEGAGLVPPSGTVQVGQFEYPMLVAADLDQARREAASNLLRSYGSHKYTDLLISAGFGPAVPQGPARPEAAVATAVDQWESYSSSDLAWLSTSLRMGCASEASSESTSATAVTCRTVSWYSTNTLIEAFHFPYGSRSEKPTSPFSKDCSG
jgi:hypothetical protein